MSSGLKLLAEDDTQRSKIARLRDVINEIEVALASGVKRTAIVAELEKHGLQMSASTFRGTLRRLRVQRGPQAHHRTSLARELGTSVSAPAEASGSSSPVAVSLEQPSVALPNRMEDRSHDPAELQKIMRNKPDLSQLSKLARKAQ